MKRVVIVAAAAAVALHFIVAAHGRVHESPGVDPEIASDADGNLHVPDAYRTEYQMLGSWAIMAAGGDHAEQIHVVYASPGAITAYRKDGHFSDGTLLVKEVFQAQTKLMTTGVVSHEANLKGWFVMVKDSRNSHPGNKLWGDGWGWSWFDATNPAQTTSTDYKKDCLGCHTPAQASDWIYTEGYPLLKSSSESGQRGGLH